MPIPNAELMRRLEEAKDSLNRAQARARQEKSLREEREPQEPSRGFYGAPTVPPSLLEKKG